MPTKAVQQFMLGTVLGNENEARQTLTAMKAAGYDGAACASFSNATRYLLGGTPLTFLKTREK